MNLMLSVTFPSLKGDDVGKAFIDLLQANPMPEYVKLTEYYQSWGGDGFIGHVFYNLDDANIHDAFRYITNLTWEMAKKVEGWRVLNQDVVSSLAEAYEYLGTASPAV